jgi:hypothetical protein
MSDFTPTTQQVRYLCGTLVEAEFDRWLAAHDEQIRSAERERCAQIAEDYLTSIGRTELAGMLYTRIRAVPVEPQQKGVVSLHGRSRGWVLSVDDLIEEATDE